MSKEIAIRIAIIVLCIIFFSFKSGDITSQFTGDENFYFESSRNMLESGDWLTPRYFGKPRFQKPFLYYWFVAASFKVFGVNWFAARFPSILLASLVVLLAYLMAGILFKSTPLSILSALILATTFKFFKYARFAIPDMALLFFITLAIYFFIKLLIIGVRLRYRSRTPIWVAFVFSLGLATLTKGPIGVIIPLLVIATFLFFSKERLKIRKNEVLLGIFLYLLITLPWFLAMLGLHGKDFVSQVWFREIANRVKFYSGTKEGAAVFLEYLAALFFYIPILIIRFLPWSVFLPLGVYKSFSAAKAVGGKKSEHILILSWFFAVFILFTLMGEKHSQYMLALSVPFALIVASGFSRGRWLERRWLAVPFALSLITALVFFAFLSGNNFRLNNAIMGGFASSISVYGLDEGDQVAMGSHELIPQHLEAYLDRPVEKISVKWYDSISLEGDRQNRQRLEGLFAPGSFSFCIISKEDLFKYASPELIGRLKIIHKNLMWKRRLEITKDKLLLLLRGKVGPFLDSFKKEYYLVTNK